MSHATNSSKPSKSSQSSKSASNNQSQTTNKNNTNILQFPNRPAPQQIPNTPFILYPANSENNKTNNNNNNNVELKPNNNNNNDVEMKMKENNDINGGNIIEIDYPKNRNYPSLTNDINNVISEIDTIHQKIYHLRRTNKEIREFYSDDPDCIQALNENIQVINNNLENIFVYFQLFRDLTNGQIHKLEKIYETDKKVLIKYQNMKQENVKDISMKQNNDDQQCKDKNVKNLKVENADETEKNGCVDDENFVVDEDGGIML